MPIKAEPEVAKKRGRPQKIKKRSEEVSLSKGVTGML